MRDKLRHSERARRAVQNHARKICYFLYALLANCWPCASAERRRTIRRHNNAVRTLNANNEGQGLLALKNAICLHPRISLVNRGDELMEGNGTYRSEERRVGKACRSR